jgi:hypothetical protein
MIGTLLFVVFVVLMLAGVPIAVALGAAGMAAMARRKRRCALVGPAGGAAEPARRHRQVPAARAADVRAGGLDLRPQRRGTAHGDVRACAASGAARACCRWWRSWSR